MTLKNVSGKFLKKLETIEWMNEEKFPETMEENCRDISFSINQF